MRISDWSSDVCSSDLVGIDADLRRQVANRGCLLEVAVREVTSQRKWRSLRHAHRMLADGGMGPDEPGAGHALFVHCLAEGLIGGALVDESPAMRREAAEGRGKTGSASGLGRVWSSG